LQGLSSSRTSKNREVPDIEFVAKPRIEIDDRGLEGFSSSGLEVTIGFVLHTSRPRTGAVGSDEVMNRFLGDAVGM